MTLDEFIAEEHARIDAFKAMWVRNMAKDERTPDGDPIFPAEMEPGDWDSQLLMYDVDDEKEDNNAA